MTSIASRVKFPWHVPVIFAITYVIHHLDRNVIAYSIPQIARDFAWTDSQVGEYGQFLLGAFFLTFGRDTLNRWCIALPCYPRTGSCGSSRTLVTIPRFGSASPGASRRLNRYQT
jgi:hypothetical protein